MPTHSSIASSSLSGFSWRDLAALAVVGAVIYIVVTFADEWSAPLQQAVKIDLSVRHLPLYAFYSLMRGVVAYGVSFLFTMVYGYAMARSRGAERIMLPLLDILQSIPVLGFLPGFVLALVHLFPHRNLGLEMASVLMIFTGQAWNMTFSFYNSLKSVPPDLVAFTRMSGLSWWQRFLTLDLSFAAPGLVWNSMMSMAGGWFFLAVSEAFTLGEHDFRLPGLGSYMSVAIEQGDGMAQVLGVVAMVTIIVLLDVVVWRPVVAWAQRFSDQPAPTGSLLVSWDWWERTRLAALLGGWLRKFSRVLVALPICGIAGKQREESRVWPWVARVFGLLCLLGVAGFALMYLDLVRKLSWPQWLGLVRDCTLTFARVLVAVALATMWTVPIGVWIGRNKRWATRLQPVIQTAASFPAPMLFPLVLVLTIKAGISIELSSVLLLMLGTQWYVLFNVIAGASGLPRDLDEVCMLSGLTRMRRWRAFVLPAIFPHLLTGWITAMGGAWNASIVAEFIRFHSETLTATGLGSTISNATAHGDFALLAASVGLMAVSVVAFNRLVWRPLSVVAQHRYVVQS
jgi:NitT/TauT family transport system permease protein